MRTITPSTVVRRLLCAVALIAVVASACADDLEGDGPDIALPTMTAPTLPPSPGPFSTEPSNPDPTSQTTTPPAPGAPASTSPNPDPMPSSTTHASPSADEGTAHAAPGRSDGDRGDGWDAFWSGGEGATFGWNGFFTGFASSIAAMVAGFAYAMTGLVLAIALFAVMFGLSLAMWPLFLLAAVLGTVLGGLFGVAGVAVAVLVVTAFALGRLRRPQPPSQPPS